MLDKLCKQENVDFSDKAFEAVSKNFQSATLEDLLANIGASLQSARDVFNAAFPTHKIKPAVVAEKAGEKASLAKPKPKGGFDSLTLKGLIPGMAVHYARCCHPLPGDTIIGIVTTGKGVTIHTTDCETLESFARTPERWIDVGWDDGHSKDDHSLVGRLSVVLNNPPQQLWRADHRDRQECRQHYQFENYQPYAGLF